jgi:hypothetical protein
MKIQNWSLISSPFLMTQHVPASVIAMVTCRTDIRALYCLFPYFILSLEYCDGGIWGFLTKRRLRGKSSSKISMISTSNLPIYRPHMSSTPRFWVLWESYSIQESMTS